MKLPGKNKETNNTSNLYLDVFSFFQASLILVPFPTDYKQVQSSTCSLIMRCIDTCIKSTSCMWRFLSSPQHMLVLMNVPNDNTNRHYFSQFPFHSARGVIGLSQKSPAEIVNTKELPINGQQHKTANYSNARAFCIRNVTQSVIMLMSPVIRSPSTTNSLHVTLSPVPVVTCHQHIDRFLLQGFPYSAVFFYH